jgi:hypothetical protein
MILKLRIKNVYGNELIYPANETAETFARLVGKKTFDKRDLENIKKLGFTLEIETPTL